jgi:hypothetical protein
LSEGVQSTAPAKEIKLESTIKMKVVLNALRMMLYVSVVMKRNLQRPMKNEFDERRKGARCARKKRENEGRTKE